LTSEVCAECRQPSDQEAFCPHCFAIRQPSSPRFTAVVANAPLLPKAPPAVTSPTPLQLGRVEYRAPSWLARTLIRSRKTITSLLVVSLILLVGYYFWSTHRRELIAQHHQRAALAFQHNDLGAALNHYEKSQKLHQSLFDRAGQVRDLIAQSHCLAKRREYVEARVRLQRATALEVSPDISLAMASVHRRAGLRSWEQAQEEMLKNHLPKASHLMDLSLQQLNEGEASPVQLASAHRLAAAISVRRAEREKAERHLARARELEGDSPSNQALAREIASLVLEQRRARELALQRAKEKDAAALARARRSQKPAQKAVQKPVQKQSYVESASRHSSTTAGPRLPTYLPSSLMTGSQRSRVPSSQPLPRPTYPTYQPAYPTLQPASQSNYQPNYQSNHKPARQSNSWNGNHPSSNNQLPSRVKLPSLPGLPGASSGAKR
jgi:hypothetical protein